MRNRYAGTCSVCRAHVAPEQGDYDPTTRAIRCLPCAGVRADARPMIKVVRVGQREVSFAPTGFLGGDLFGKFREAISGARFEPSNKTNVVPVAKALGMVSALQAHGFVVDLPNDLAATLQAQRSEQQSLIFTAGTRATEIDQKLRERGLALFPFQRIGIRWLAGRMGALLADEMGLGKTIQVIIALPERASAIVICAAVAKGVWAREIARWRPDLLPIVLEGKGSFRWPAAGEVIITNYDVLPFAPNPGLKPHQQPLTGEPLEGAVLVGDEVHAIKSTKSQRTQNFRAIGERVRAKGGRVWMTTGTPLLNRPSELWCLLQSADIAREAFGSWSEFVRAFNGSPGDYGGIFWGTPRPEVVERLRRVTLRRMRTEVLPELPTKTYQQVPVDLSKTDRKAIDKASRYILSLFPTAWDRVLSDDDPFETSGSKSERLTAADVAHARELMSATESTSFEAISHGRKLLSRAKIPAMLDFVEDYEEQDEPLVVFSAHREPIDLLGTREGWAIITGDTPPSERTRIEDDFQAGRLKGIAGTIKAAGVAITLTRAHHVLFVDREFVPGLNDQAEDRVCRIGQTRGCVIHDLVAKHALDRILFEILGKKEAIIEHSVDAASVGDDYEPSEIPDVDFQRLAALAELEIEAAEGAERLARLRRQQAEDERLAYQTERLNAQRDGRVVATVFLAPGRRAPTNAREEWALRAIITLNRLDPDQARTLNGVGFNSRDSGYGHRLGERVYDGLTDREWQIAVLLCGKYWRQVGRPPE